MNGSEERVERRIAARLGGRPLGLFILALCSAGLYAVVYNVGKLLRGEQFWYSHAVNFLLPLFLIIGGCSVVNPRLGEAAMKGQEKMGKSLQAAGLVLGAAAVFAYEGLMKSQGYVTVLGRLWELVLSDF